MPRANKRIIEEFCYKGFHVKIWQDTGEQDFYVFISRKKKDGSTFGYGTWKPTLEMIKKRSIQRCNDFAEIFADDF